MNDDYHRDATAPPRWFIVGRLIAEGDLDMTTFVERMVLATTATLALLAGCSGADMPGSPDTGTMDGATIRDGGDGGGPRDVGADVGAMGDMGVLVDGAVEPDAAAADDADVD